MRRDERYLLDIVEAADAIARFLHGVAEARFVQDDLLRSAVLQKLTIIGEAAGRLSLAFQSGHSEIEWRDVAAFRNIAVHAYFSVQWPIVWVAATGDAPALRRQIARLLAAEFPGKTPPDPAQDRPDGSQNHGD